MHPWAAAAINDGTGPAVWGGGAAPHAAAPAGPATSGLVASSGSRRPAVAACGARAEGGAALTALGRHGAFLAVWPPARAGPPHLTARPWAPHASCSVRAIAAPKSSATAAGAPVAAPPSHGTASRAAPAARCAAGPGCRRAVAAPLGRAVVAAEPPLRRRSCWLAPSGSNGTDTRLGWGSSGGPAASSSSPVPAASPASPLTVAAPAHASSSAAAGAATSSAGAAPEPASTCPLPLTCGGEPCANTADEAAPSVTATS
jgi:hypothetical protein